MPPPPPQQAPPTTSTYNPYAPREAVPPAPRPPSLYEPGASLAPPTAATVSSGSSPSMPTIPALPPTRIVTQDISPIQRSLYVPSPSQSAADDPRTTSRIPVFRFGFGGKVVACFPRQLEANAGFDVALAGRSSSDLSLRTLKSVLPESALDQSTTEFPGPLFTGPSAGPTIALSRTAPGQTTAVKSKKTVVLKYLKERAEEIDRGIGYLSTERNDTERRSAEGRVLLLKLLVVLIENDGKLSGSPELAEHVRNAILPQDGGKALQSPGLSSLGVPMSFGLTDSTNETKEPSLATYHVRGSALDKIQSLLLSGQRREACHYALDQKMWAHALIMSSNMDRDLWKEVANEFIRAELGVQMNSAAALSSRKNPGSDSTPQSVSNGRESLRVAYSLFSGQGTSAIQELLPPKNLGKVAEPATLLIPQPTIQATPISPNFPKPAVTGPIPADVLSNWAETASTIISNTGGTSEEWASLTTLGDYLISNGWVEAAHICYLLSLQTSPIGGVGAPHVRLSLVGSESPSTRRNFHLDPDVIRYTEVVEFGLSLLPPPGKETFNGLPHLQPYKLIRAWQLSEIGASKEASKYCDSIAAIIKAHPRGSPYFTQAFHDLHQELTNRLAGNAKNTSWISRTIKKPSMDSLSTWSRSAFTKFIEGEESAPIPEEEQPVEKPVVGPFSHYSEISSATTSRLPSPTESTNGFSMNDGRSSPPPFRAGSAIGSRVPPPPSAPDRAASAMGYMRTARASPPLRAGYSAGPGVTNFAQAYGSNGINGSAANPSVFTPPPAASSYGNGWWGASNGDEVEEAEGPTPTASSFNPSQEEGSFVSLMDSYTPAPSATITPSRSSSARQNDFDDDDDDLGLGNASSRPKAASAPPAANGDSDGDQPESKADEKKEDDKPEAAASKGWFGGWWGGGAKSDKPKPVRANLGESKSSFYYDKELKRWVNGKEGSSAPTPAAPPPPPSRAQTASPSKMGGTNGATPPSGPPPPTGLTPPPRSQSSMGLGPPPRSTPPGTVRAPSGLSSSFVPPVGGEGGLAPPASPGPPRTKSAQGQRKNARSRYVDVFNAPPS
ncbi:hypothetical protein DL93DRAFT_2082714 [Clavulina sp. PMI_390]|nr:hypothetical protein DL93DRAFT_2082714 [Clavulina sp. PMI_390]